MLGAVVLLGALAVLAPKRRPRLRGLGESTELVAPGGSAVYLLRPADFAHPAQRAATAAADEASGGPWAVVSGEGWQGAAKHFRTAKEARVTLRAAGFKGPYGKGVSSRWTR